MFGVANIVFDILLTLQYVQIVSCKTSVIGIVLVVNRGSAVHEHVFTRHVFRIEEFVFARFGVLDEVSSVHIDRNGILTDIEFGNLSHVHIGEHKVNKVYQIGILDNENKRLSRNIEARDESIDNSGHGAENCRRIVGSVRSHGGHRAACRARSGHNGVDNIYNKGFFYYYVLQAYTLEIDINVTAFEVKTYENFLLYFVIDFNGKFHHFEQRAEIEGFDTDFLVAGEQVDKVKQSHVSVYGHYNVVKNVFGQFNLRHQIFNRGEERREQRGHIQHSALSVGIARTAVTARHYGLDAEFEAEANVFEFYFGLDCDIALCVLCKSKRHYLDVFRGILNIVEGFGLEVNQNIGQAETYSQQICYLRFKEYGQIEQAVVV